MRTVFTISSIIFHPLLLVLYILLLTLHHNPYIFGMPDMGSAGIIIIYCVFLSFIIPMVAILLFKGTGLIESLSMKSRMERIGPLIATTLFYLWFYINCKTNLNIPLSYTLFVLGTLATLFLSFVINVFYKLSLHAAGLAGVVMYLIILYLYQADLVFESATLFSYIILSLLILGFICTGRLYLRAHSMGELTVGVSVGLLAQVFAFLYIY